MSELFGGLQIIVDDKLMAPMVADWSEVRSPSRARRRLKRGFPQRVKWVQRELPDAYRIGDRVIMSSATFAKLREAMND